VAWPSLVTGLSPAKTGIFDAVRTRNGTYDLLPTNLTGYRGDPIWLWINRFGRSAGVLNVPMTFPAPPLHGYLVSGFDSPRDSPRVAYPSDLLEQFAAQGHPYRVLDEETDLMDHQNPHQPRGDLQTFASRWIRLTQEMGELLAWLWQHRPVDLMFAVFSGTDSINHRTNRRDLIDSVYRSADTALGQLLAVVSAKTLVCLVSDHGSTKANRYVAINRALHDGGWLRFRPEVAERFFGRLPTPLARLAQAIWSRLPTNARRAASWPLLRLKRELATGYENIDWENTRVCARTGMGALYVNLCGRQVQGCVPAEEYDSLREEVIHRLITLTDDSGQSVFGDVVRCESVYPGARNAYDPPDLVCTPARWADHLVTGHATDPTVRPIPVAHDYGTHTPYGILAMAGPGVASGTTLGAAQIVDVVPSILGAWGLPIPAGVDGRVLGEAYRTPPVERRMASDQPGEGIAAEVGSREVLHRLQALGYLD
jgi:predicted AlkP superfamily phosphohydrolase/phosphomutase